MAKWVPKSGEVSIKIAIVGQPNSGKKNIIEYVAEQYDQSALKFASVSGAEIVRTEFIWPEPVADGPFVRVGLLALSEQPLHQAAEQLLLADCDGLVFVVNCDPSKISECKSTLASLMSNASRVGLDWGETMLILQYNNAEQYPNTTPEDLDSWLGVNIERVERYHTESNNRDHQVLAVNAAIRGVIAKITQQSAPEAEVAAAAN